MRISLSSRRAEPMFLSVAINNRSSHVYNTSFVDPASFGSSASPSFCRTHVKPPRVRVPLIRLYLLDGWENSVQGNEKFRYLQRQSSLTFQRLHLQLYSNYTHMCPSMPTDAGVPIWYYAIIVSGKRPRCMYVAVALAFSKVSSTT